MRKLALPLRVDFSMAPLAFFFIFILGCSSPKPEDIRIGLILDNIPNILTTHEGPMLAVKLVNDAGGLEVAGKRHTISVSMTPGIGQPEEATQAALKLINQDHVIGFVGPSLSRNAIPVASVAENARIPMISPMSTNPETTANRRFVFRIAFTDPFQGQVLARFAREDLRAKTAAVLFDETDTYAKGIAVYFQSTFKQTGGEVPAFMPFTPDVKDFGTIAAKLAQVKPDVIFLPSAMDQHLELQVKALKSNGLRAQLLGSDICLGEHLKINPDFEGAFFSDHWSTKISTPESVAFIKNFQQVYGKDPDSIAANGFDAMQILLTSIQHAGGIDPLSIRQAIVDLPPFVGVSGMIDYQDTGDPIKSVYIMKLSHGELLAHKRIDPRK